MNLSTLPRGVFARQGNQFFLGCGKGEAFSVMPNQKCERIGPIKEGAKEDVPLEITNKEEFELALNKANHSGDWFSKLCQNAIVNFTMDCAY